MSDNPKRRLMSNRGGGCIQDHRVLPAPPGDHLLELRCPAGVVDQVRLVDSRYDVMQTIAGSGRHVLRSSGSEPLPETRHLISLLENVLTLPAPSPLDFAIALDWYKSPADDVSSDQWPHSDVGDLVYRGKYWYYEKPNRLGELREVGTALVERLTIVVREHPLLRAASVIVDVPGHDSKRTSFGSQVAHSVSRATGMRFVRCASSVPFRTPAKSLDLDKRRKFIENTFECPADLQGHSVIIVDDIYSTGTSVAEAARAVRLAGARHVAALCAVRTLRS